MFEVQYKIKPFPQAADRCHENSLDRYVYNFLFFKRTWIWRSVRRWKGGRASAGPRRSLSHSHCGQGKQTYPRAVDPDPHGSALIFPPVSGYRRGKFKNKSVKNAKKSLKIVILLKIL